MTTMEDEIIAACNLIERHYNRLKERDPQHDLLKFVRITPRSVKVLNEHAKEFYERFPSIHPRSGNWHSIHGLIAYYQALEVAHGSPVPKAPKEVVKEVVRGTILWNLHKLHNQWDIEGVATLDDPQVQEKARREAITYLEELLKVFY